MFIVGYALLITHVVVERWGRMGDGALSFGAYFSFVALAVNIIAIVMLLRERTVGYEDAEEFKASLKLLEHLNRKKWTELHPNVPFPPSRLQDELGRMTRKQLLDHLEKLENDPS
jgi:hypothetical protein